MPLKKRRIKNKILVQKTIIAITPHFSPSEGPPIAKQNGNNKEKN